jgi:sterol desaturase/sphingolipid hydroxylase (fatty acid hydroxylase superfamily)
MESTSSNENYEFRVYPDEKSPKLFKSPLLEVLTKTKLWIIIVLYSVVAAVWLWVYMYYFQGTIIKLISLFFLGFFTWTFGEYVLHRFVYHKLKDASYDTGIQYMFHGIHHQYPSDDDRIILPPVPGLIIACALLGVFYLLMGAEAFTFGPGFLIGYMVYISIHWMVHSKPAPARFNFWWRHHNIHHYQQHDKAFGVSTPIWDIVFRTMPIKGRKTITILKK